MKIDAWKKRELCMNLEKRAVNNTRGRETEGDWGRLEMFIVRRCARNTHACACIFELCRAVDLNCAYRSACCLLIYMHACIRLPYICVDLHTYKEASIAAMALPYIVWIHMFVIYIYIYMYKIVCSKTISQIFNAAIDINTDIDVQRIYFVQEMEK